MDEIIENVETTDYEDSFDETTEVSSDNSGLIGAVVGGVIVAAGAAAFNAVKRHPKVQEFIANRQEARRQKKLKKWVETGVKNGFMPADTSTTEE